MGNTYSGRNMWAAIGIQSAKGTAAKYGKFYQPSDVGGFIEQYNMIESARRVGTRFKGAGYLGSKQIPFNLTLEANTANIGYLLYALTGTETGTALTTPTRTKHAFTIAQELPYLTIMLYSAGIADNSGTNEYHVITDAKISKASISGGTDNVITIQIEGIGITRVVRSLTFACSISTTTVTVASGLTTGLLVGMPITIGSVSTTIASITNATTFVTTDAGTVGSTSATVTPVFDTGKPLFMASDEGTAALAIGDSTPGTAYVEARSVKLDIDNALKSDHRINSTSAPYAIGEGDSALTGSIDCIFNNESYAEISKFQAGTSRYIALTITSTNLINGSTYESLAVIITSARYTSGNPNWATDAISVELPFTVEVSLGFEIDLVDDFAYKYDAAKTAIS